MLIAWTWTPPQIFAPQLAFEFGKDNMPGALQTQPAGINNAGVTVGDYEDSGGVSHGYILDGKKLTVKARDCAGDLAAKPGKRSGEIRRDAGGIG